MTRGQKKKIGTARALEAELEAEATENAPEPTIFSDGEMPNATAHAMAQSFRRLLDKETPNSKQRLLDLSRTPDVVSPTELRQEKESLGSLWSVVEAETTKLEKKRKSIEEEVHQMRSMMLSMAMEVADVRDRNKDISRKVSTVARHVARCACCWDIEVFKSQIEDDFPSESYE
eukprot:TRINITY_DN13738_c0_g1_i1.p2 TRINITY_DN13738_c0_g1~~TRINITY_DN13738_c0_g1_i1.p2  ORF type:complete len:174 (-),score=28.04 TRINITY_DN13738_c0_g1_i1:173-694(-)